MKPILRNNISRVVVKMHSEPLLISVLLLLGLISIGYTAPPGKPVVSDVHNTTSSSIASGSVNQTPSPIERLHTFQQACSTTNGKELEKDCLAYNHLAGVMKERKIWNNDTEQVFSLELSRTLLPQQFLCINLTAVIKKIPKELKSDSLKPFEHWKECVMVCSEGDDDTWKDSCRVLLAGYSALVHSMEKPVIESKTTLQHSSTEQIAAKDQQNSVSILQSKAANGDRSVGKGQIIKVIPESDTNLRSDVKSHEDVSGNVGTVIKGPASTPEKPKSVEVSVQGVKKEEKIEKQPPPFPQLDQGSMDKKMNSADTEQDGLDDDDDPTDGKGATNNFEDYRDDSEESDARVPQENINDTPNAADKHEQPIENKQMPQKVRPQDEFTGLSRNSDIVQGSDPFYNQNDSNFFSYFLFAMFSCAILYVAYHNKSKLMALVVEGRRTNNGRGGFSKGRKHTAAYRKLDSNLEEAITSGSASGGHSSSQIIY